MDDDIRADLKVVSKEVQAVGRKIGSTKLDAEDLKILSKALVSHSKTLKKYSDIQKNR